MENSMQRQNPKMRNKEHPLYTTWKNIRRRCNAPKDRAYPWYGAKGVRLADEWNDFWQFVEDVGVRPDGAVLDRIDSSGNYAPGNVQWITQRDNVLKCDRVHKHNGVPVTELARKQGLNPKIVAQRIRRGWTINRALETTND